ncbi:multidrug effflux MFS transporter [Terricaulis silvestris]|uniref:Bcr/CflA family efflux transporter n=1 Tax=Terricaulis silvestris TaxID=2686094 RepID=A0A6I6MY95_9CAUL|nr:multidrug effflux MFS transporter [Terricaulis silvestris]QGZ96133.1 Sulfonamide resistance protein [Terricaulis silvestris]
MTNSITLHSSASSAARLTPALVTLLACLAALGALSTNIILPSFPTMAADLGATTRELGVTVSGFLLAFALGQIVVGPLSDRYGRKPFVLGGLVVFVAGSVVAASGDSLGLVVAGRVIQALGVCAASVLSRAIARDLFDGAALGRALAFTMVAMAAAPGFSPLLGAAIDSTLGWRASFLFVGALGFLVALFYGAALGETNPPARRSSARFADIVGAYGQLLVNPSFIPPALSVSLIVGGLYAFFASAPAILIDDMQLDTIEFGMFFAATVLVVFGSGMIAPRLAKRFGQKQIALAGAVIALAGAIILLASGLADFGLAGFAVAITIFLLGMGMANPLGTAITLHPFGHQAGIASALLGFLQMGCAAVAITSAALFATTAAIALAIVLLVSTGIAVVFFMAAPNDRQEDHHDA